MDKTDNNDNVKIEVKREIVNKLIKFKKVGMTYSEVIEYLLLQNNK